MVIIIIIIIVKSTFKGVPQLTGTTTLLVEVINSNDKQPYFSPESQRTEVSESAPIGTVVYKLHAIDPDVAREDDLRYEITEPIIAIDSNGKSVSHTKEYEVLFHFFFYFISLL